jgi:hypothetical protein
MPTKWPSRPPSTTIRPPFVNGLRQHTVAQK